MDNSSSQKNSLAVRNLMEFNDNPNPISLLIVMVIFFIVIYYGYVNFIKCSFGGIWIHENNKFLIKHNLWSDKISIRLLGTKVKYRGFVSGNAIYYNGDGRMRIGTLYNKDIYWFGSGDIWSKPATIEL